MGGIVSRERRHKSRRPAPSQPQAEEVYPEAAQSKSPSRVDTVKTEPRTVPVVKRVPENQELTEEMIEGLTRSSSDTCQSKAHKKDVLENWLLRANYRVTIENDALERHRRSMEALQTMQVNKKDRAVRPRSQHSRSNSRSKASRTRQPPNVEVYRGTQAVA